MRIVPFTIEGPLPTEIPALKTIEAEFPRQWLGYSNVSIRNAKNRLDPREVDLVMVTDDRILMVDLKHWRGRLELVDGYWHKDGERWDYSPVRKMEENMRFLLRAFDDEGLRMARPRIEKLVVLTHPQCDTSLLGQDADAVVRLPEFLRLKDAAHYRKRFPRGTPHGEDPLNAGSNRRALEKFFRPGSVFEVRRTRFAKVFEAAHPSPEFSSGLYDEYLARDVANPLNEALLRVWNFTADDELRLGFDRRELLDRERAAIAFLTDRDPVAASVALRPGQRDPELGPRHWELFDRDRHLQRLSSLGNGALADLDLVTRRELAKVLTGHVAGLHRAQLAHRDIGEHSIWVDPARLRILMSSFGSSRFPERQSVGELRHKLLGSGLAVPEDTGVVDPGTAYQHDVFLLGVAVWRLLGDVAIPTEKVSGTGPDGREKRVPNWSDMSEEVVGALPGPVAKWLSRCLDWDPAARFGDGVEAHDALAAAVAGGGARNLGALDLACYEDEVDPLVDYPAAVMIQRGRCRVYETVVDGVTMLVKNWPSRVLGDRAANAARLIEFFARADRLRSVGATGLPKVERACLSLEGLFLLQDYVPGQKLDEADLTGWGADRYRSFFKRLLELVAEAHEAGIAHGDLSPGNVIVAAGEGAGPHIIDFLDFSTDADGDRITTAYVPPAGGSDPHVRDRYAAALMAAEAAGRVSSLTGEELAGIKRAFDACGGGEAPWATLKPLLDALSGDHRAAPSERYTLLLGFPTCSLPGPALADDGEFRVVLSQDRDRITIVGFDSQTDVFLDAATRSVRSVSQSEAKAGTHAWASRNTAFTFRGEMTAFQSPRTSAEGLDHLLRNETVLAWLEGRPVPDAATPPPRRADVTRASPFAQLPTARLWHEQIIAEGEIRPSVTVVEAGSPEGSDGLVVVLHDDGARLDQVEDDDPVYFNGVYVGTVDKRRMNAGSFAFHAHGNLRLFKAGDVLTIKPRRSEGSYKRRKQAVERILRGRTPIDHLISYFDPSAHAAPRQVAEPVEEGDLAPYGFNADQTEAFRLLWENGPVGLLQGPPGTGKTTFISGFVHYALTKGGCRNVLLVSQSHEAVNTAAERIQDLVEKSNVDMIRVSNDPEKVSDALRRSHVGAIQGALVARLDAGAKERLCMVARRLGLPKAFAEDLHEAFEGPVVASTQIDRLRLLIDRERDGDGDVLERRLRAVEDARAAQLGRWVDPTSVGAHADAGDVETMLVAALQETHDVRDRSAVDRLRAVYRTGRQWAQVLRTRSRTLEEFLVGSRRLVCGTCVGIGEGKLRITEKAFDLVVVDEAARAASGELAVAMQSAKRILLVGDHKQLPALHDPELLEQLTLRTGLGEDELTRSDFQRTFESPYGGQVGSALRRQYRMASKIATMISDVFYPEVGLITARRPPGPHYGALPHPFDDEFGWVDVAAAESRRGTSFSNVAEAKAIVAMLESLFAEAAFLTAARAELKQDEPLVGVICMYKPQRDLVRDLLAASRVAAELRILVKVETVDSYQGKENRIVIVSTVRSNERGRIGFLDKEYRINVALSRAMDRLVIVGAASMFRGSGSKLSDVLAIMEAGGRVQPLSRGRQEAA